MTTPLAASQFNLISDGELLAACQDGEESAWDELVTRYEQLVYTIIVRYKLELPEEGEIFHSIWLSFLRNLDKLKRSGQVAAWLIATTRRELRKRQHNDKYRRSNEGDRTNGKRPPVNQNYQSIEEIVTAYGRYEATHRALGTLDAQSQRLLRMLYSDPIVPSHEAIAAKLNVSRDSVDQLRVGALEKLRQTILDFT